MTETMMSGDIVGNRYTGRVRSLAQEEFELGLCQLVTTKTWSCSMLLFDLLDLSAWFNRFSQLYYDLFNTLH